MSSYDFSPFEEEKHLELVLEWLLETKLQIPGAAVNAELEREQYFKAVAEIQSRNRCFASMLLFREKPVGFFTVKGKAF